MPHCPHTHRRAGAAAVLASQKVVGMISRAGLKTVHWWQEGGMPEGKATAGPVVQLLLGLFTPQWALWGTSSGAA